MYVGSYLNRNLDNEPFQVYHFLSFSSTTGSGSSPLNGEEGTLSLPSRGSLETPEHSSSLMCSTGSFVILILSFAFDLASDFALTGGLTSSTTAISITAS